MKRERLEELLYQALETEIGGIAVYETALQCVRNDELKDEFEKYHEQTQHHEEVVREMMESLGLDPEKETPGRRIVRMKGQALVAAMQAALEDGKSEAAELIAAECVVDAEMKDHANWDLIGQVAKKLKGDGARALRKAYEEVEDEEDQHLYHTMGWARELWIQFLGMPAVLPPPEEEKDVKSAIGAARARQERRDML
jgi:rubrerythrin